MITTPMLLGLAWKSAAVAGLILILLRLARRRSAGERSMIAHAGLVALLALPAAMLLLPAWAPLPESWTAAAASAPLAAAPVAGAAAPAVSVAAETARFTLPGVGDLAPFLYAIPLALLSGMMLLAVVRLFAMRGRAEVLTQGSWLSALAEAQRRMGFKHGTALLVSKELRSPISWGVLRPTIVLSPVTVDAVDEAEAIIAHELAHVARLDWAKLLGARVACAVFWFNPLVWMLARESHQLREEAADDAVLMADIDGPDYATLLVGAARHDNQGALLAAHGVAPGKGSLKRRITRVLDGSLKRGPASASWMLMSLVLLAGVTAPLAAFSATADHSGRTAKDVRVPSLASAPAAIQSTAAVGGNQGGETAPAAATRKPLTADQLVSMRAVGVTPEYVAEMREHGGSMDPDDIIAAKATGVDPAYVRAMRGVFPGADMDDLIGASALHIDPGYAREMKAQFPGLSIDDLVGMRAVGVTGDYIRRMRGAGYALKTPDDAIELRATGMTGRATAKATTRREDRATVEIGRGVLEARSADGRVARIAFPEPPAPPAAPEN
ncbi:hypothetical protein CVO77_07520 [Sphingopyxis lindanitolerans]|uniref:Peptidase M56 domain-containing protein n=1 Tax=Sphingopyxis lindanitolerans TaxID=2054227 RepID=A0A2S8B7F6_9SPHN|nr:M56 family metallopeptidase [Sphingopyxis lindanitolerans]PQM28334.1 hypothetical protein CVO77_07520 [Sphingopyxis lindanitolerans]